MGIIALLDEECLRPGDVSDMTFLKKLDATVIKHPHYDSREKLLKTNEKIDIDIFRLKHYAGNVNYCVDGFLDKNVDNLTKDILYGMNSSQKPVCKLLFPEDPSSGDLKRPDTLGTQFRASMQQLMANLLAKNPHYIRCIKPNSTKTPSKFDNELVLHQARYLGLLENVRVRRAGFCFRQRFDKFIERYKASCKQTWPNWKGDLSQGVKLIMSNAGVGAGEFQLGSTKVFIKNPKTLFALEEKREKALGVLASKIRARWLAFINKRKYQRDRKNLIRLQATWRMHEVHHLPLCR